MTTGENEQGLRKIAELSRAVSLALLALHTYYFYYAAFGVWDLTYPLSDRLLENLARTGLFTPESKAKGLALFFLGLSLLGTNGRKQPSLRWRNTVGYFLVGAALYFGSDGVRYLSLPATTTTLLYMAVMLSGYIAFLTGGTLLSRILQVRLRSEVFNKDNETFPQEERRLENPYSVNLPAHYTLKGKTRASWINLVNPFRGVLVMGSPGSGKSYFVVRPIIRQHLEKGFALLVYDFKWDDLTRYTYHHFLKNQSRFKIPPSFYLLNFDDLAHSHRCNPLAPGSLHDITDAAEAARTILLALNRDWIRKQGDFFVESAVNFVTALIWYLRLREGGRYCTLPHVVELMQVPNEKLFSLLHAESEVAALVNPFVTAFEAGVMEQVEGQVAAAKIALARLSSPALYYVLSGDDFTLDINNPEAPKVVCLGNNPQKTQVYGAVLSLYLSRLVRTVNLKGGGPVGLVLDEFPSVFVGGIDSLLATARSNRVATTLVVQDASQLRKDYGREQAEVVVNLPGNVLAGQVTGDTARGLSERCGRILQPRQSLSVNSSDTSLNTSHHLEAAVPPSALATLSAGEFVGLVADEVNQVVPQKVFHARLLPPPREAEDYALLPRVRVVEPAAVRRHYEEIKAAIQTLVEREIARLVR